MILKKAKGLVCILLAVTFLLSASSCSYLRDFYGQGDDTTTLGEETTPSGDETTASSDETTDSDNTAVTFPVPEIEMNYINP